MNEEKTWENMEKRRAKEREKYGRMIEKELVHSLLNDEIPLETSNMNLVMVLFTEINNFFF